MTANSQRLASEPTFAVAEDGARIAYLQEGDAGIPILFCNSLASDWRMWNRVVERLGPSRRIRFDARGHGGSEAPAGPYSLEDLGRDALAVLDKCGVDRVVVCGLSLGGLVGMWLAVNAPKRVAGLILANTAANFLPAQMWKDRANTALDQGMEVLAKATIERWFTPPFRDRHPEIVDDMRSMIASTPPVGYAGSCAALAETDMLRHLSAIACPVLVIAGAGDRSTPPEKAQEIASLLKDGEIRSLEAAHMSAVEQPENFARLLIAATNRFDN